MALHRLLNNFSGGEWSPQLDARVDLAKYDSACIKMENMRPLPWGGTQFRGGTLKLSETKGSGFAQLIEFQFNTTTTYLLEIGDLYMRFYSGEGEQIETSPGVPYEITTPWLSSEVSEVQFKEINDVMYMVQRNHPPQKLSRLAETNWTLTEVPWKYPPLMDENLDLAETLQLVPQHAGSFVVGVTYRITFVGSTNFVAIGASANELAVEFTATGAGSGTGIALQSTGGGVWLDSSSARFTSSNIGGYWELRHLRDASRLEMDISITSGSTTTASMRVKGDWTFNSFQRWWGVINIQRSTDDGATWEVVRQFRRKGDGNIVASGTQYDEALFRLQFFAEGDAYSASVWAGAIPTQYIYASAVFETSDAYISGLVKVTSILSSTRAVVTIIDEVEKGDETSTWSEGAFSIARGFPRAVGLYEQRILYAGTSYKPNTIWGSVAAGYDDFTYSELDDAAVLYQFASSEQNPIQWLESLERIAAGTTADENSVGSGNTDEPLTPSNVTVRTQSNQGSELIQPLGIGKSILFVQRQGTRIREFKEGNPYVENGAPMPEDLTLLAEHITAEGVTGLAFARLPDPTVFAVLGEDYQLGNHGQLGVMTYNREQNITAWCRYKTDGVFESVASVYGSPSDAVFVIVRREIDGNTVRYVEKLMPAVADASQGVYADCAKVYSGAATTTITGLGHLANTRVSVVADGFSIGDPYAGTSPMVSNIGTLTLDEPASRVTVGLPYFGELRPMKPDTNLGNGTSQGRKRRISEFVIRFKDSLGCRYGNGSSQRIQLGQYASDIPFRSNSDNMDQQIPLFTGDKVLLPLDAGNNLDDEIVITQTQPLPLTILGIFAKMEFFGS